MIAKRQGREVRRPHLRRHWRKTGATSFGIAIVQEPTVSGSRGLIPMIQTLLIWASMAGTTQHLKNAMFWASINATPYVHRAQASLEWYEEHHRTFGVE